MTFDICVTRIECCTSTGGLLQLNISCCSGRKCCSWQDSNLQHLHVCKSSVLPTYHYTTGTIDQTSFEVGVIISRHNVIKYSKIFNIHCMYLILTTQHIRIYTHTYIIWSNGYVLHMHIMEWLHALYDCWPKRHIYIRHN